MKRIFPVILLSLLIAACSTMPKEIEDKYLVEKTTADSQTISAMEEKIIVKNREKQGVEEKIKTQPKLPDGIEQEIKLLKDGNALLKDEIFFYEEHKDAVNLEAKKTQLGENETKYARKTAIVQHHDSEKKLFEAELDLKNAELAQYIAELNVEKARIAAVYRDKNEVQKPETEESFFSKIFNHTDPDDKYGYKKYPEYLEEKKKETLAAESRYSEAEKKFQEAKSALEKTKE